MDVQQALLSRRTIHDYMPEPIDDSAIDRALEAAVRAPNHKLTNPWRFTRVGPTMRARITRHAVALKVAKKIKKKGEVSQQYRDKIAAKFGNPAALVVVSQVLDDDPFRRREDYAATACAIQNFCLSLWGEGIGSKWSTGKVTRDPGIYELLAIDQDCEEIVGFVWAGKPEVVPDPAREPLAAVVRTTE